MPKSKIRVLLVDDHGLVRRGFRRMLEDKAAIEVVGEARDGNDAVEAAAKLNSALVVMDFALPSMNGTVATRMILKQNPSIYVLVLSMHAEPNSVRTCVEAGERVLDPRLGGWPAPDSSAPALSTRELEVLQLIVHGKSNKEIAAVLGLSVNTVTICSCHPRCRKHRVRATISRSCI